MNKHHFYCVKCNNGFASMMALGKHLCKEKKPMSVKKKTRKKLKIPDFKEINKIVVFILLFFAVINIVILGYIISNLDKKIKKAEIAAKPAKIEIIKITDERCSDCFDIDAVLAQIKNANTDVKGEKAFHSNEKEAKDLIKKLGIKKLPTLIITGEIRKNEGFEKMFSRLGEFKEDTFVFTSLSPPYTDVVSGEIRGRISLEYIKDKSCKKCSDYDQYIAGLKKAKVIFAEEKTVDYKTKKGKDLIRKYNIEKIPAIIMDSEAKAYEKLKDGWDNNGTIEKDGSFVARYIYPPYRDTVSGKIKGMVEITYLKDESCKDCFSTDLLKDLVLRVGMEISNEKTVDVKDAEGKKIINKYNISKIPTMVLSNDASVYPPVSQAWEVQAGTKEQDGKYVLRKIGQIFSGLSYKNLDTGKIISQKMSSGGVPQVSETTGKVKTFDITASQFEFTPKEIIVNKGDQVNLKLKTIDVTHSFTLDEFGINEKLEPGGKITTSFIADKKGIFIFYCSIPCGEGHSRMRGKLIVK